MGDFLNSLLEKFDDFSFEVLGLILPALLFSLLLFQPLIYRRVEFTELEKILNAVSNLLSRFENFWIIVVIIVFFYTFGNVIKVVSKFYYELGKVVFDKTLFIGVNKIYLIFDDRIHINKDLKNKPFLNILNIVYKWAKNILSFSYENYGGIFKNSYIELAKNKMKISGFDENDPDKCWYLFYKKATNLLDNSNTKNMYHKFLAKYNSFRSIEVIFVFGIIYNYIFMSNFLEVDRTLYNMVLGFNVICAITFHDKFKRYWILCGNEVIAGVATYYKKENE